MEGTIEVDIQDLKRVVAAALREKEGHSAEHANVRGKPFAIVHIKKIVL